jgi:DNA-binding CsgD family transcriptional regulator/tetratricopeptide (TPR) repeat protein
MSPPDQLPAGHRRTVFGPTIDSIQRELLPALADAALEAEREAMVRSAIGRLLMQFGDWESGLEQLERAVDGLPERSVSRAASLLWLGWPYGSPRSASWHLDQVRRAVAATPDELSAADRLMLDRLYVTRLLLLGDRAGWDLVDRIPDRADEQDVALQAVLAHADLAYAALLWGRYPQADHHVRVTERLSERWYFEGFTDALQSTVVHLDWCLGRWEGLFERALALTTTGHDRFARQESLLVSTKLARACGLPERAGTDPELLLTELLPHEAPELLAMAANEAGHRRLIDGDLDGAVRVTEAAAVEVFASANWLSATELVSGRVEALVAAGRVGEAEELVAELVELAGDPLPELVAAVVAWSRAVLAEPSDPENAAVELREAAELLAALPRPYDVARVRIRLAECLVRLGDRAGAVTELRVARAGLADLRAWPLVAEIEARLARLGVRGAGTSGRRAYGAELSPRERDVVRLVAQGRTNRQIGDELVLSSKTVANHVATARRKLAASSRTALAVAAIAAGLIEHPAEHRAGHG